MKISRLMRACVSQDMHKSHHNRSRSMQCAMSRMSMQDWQEQLDVLHVSTRHRCMCRKTHTCYTLVSATKTLPFSAEESLKHKGPVALLLRVLRLVCRMRGSILTAARTADAKQGKHCPVAHSKLVPGFCANMSSQSNTISPLTRFPSGVRKSPSRSSMPDVVLRSNSLRSGPLTLTMA